MLKKLWRRLSDIEGQKFKHFAEFESLIKKIKKDYAHLFPKFSERRDGSGYVYNFGIPGVYPISLEKEHGSREFIPPKYAKRAIQGISDVLTFIEHQIAEEEAEEENEENENEGPTSDEETSGVLPESEIPDGSS